MDTTEMKNQLNAIRKIFPDWPSEFDVAKRPVHWASLAQDYYCAALIISQENDKTENWQHVNNGKQITNDIAIRMYGQRAAVFCMAFAIELIIKAVYIKEIADVDMMPNMNLSFANHRASELAKNISQVSLNEKELSAISEAEKIVINGKYPVCKKPSDTVESINIPNTADIIGKLEPIYMKYSQFIS